MIASLAEPAMIMIVFTLALVAGSTQFSTIAAFMSFSNVGLRASLALALIALIMVAIAENGRIPIDNPATHLELTMVHEAMVLEYSGRHLALIELAASLKLILYVSLIACLFGTSGHRIEERRLSAGFDDRGCGLCRQTRRRSAASSWRCSKPRSPKCGSSACLSSSVRRSCSDCLPRFCYSSREGF